MFNVTIVASIVVHRGFEIVFLHGRIRLSIGHHRTNVSLCETFPFFGEIASVVRLCQSRLSETDLNEKRGGQAECNLSSKTVIRTSTVLEQRHWGKIFA